MPTLKTVSRVKNPHTVIESLAFRFSISQWTSGFPFLSGTRTTCSSDRVIKMPLLRKKTLNPFLHILPQ